MEIEMSSKLWRKTWSKVTPSKNNFKMLSHQPAPVAASVQSGFRFHPWRPILRSQQDSLNSPWSLATWNNPMLEVHLAWTKIGIWWLVKLYYLCNPSPPLSLPSCHHVHQIWPQKSSKVLYQSTSTLFSSQSFLEWFPWQSILLNLHSLTLHTIYIFISILRKYHTVNTSKVFCVDDQISFPFARCRHIPCNLHLEIEECLPRDDDLSPQQALVQAIAGIVDVTSDQEMLGVQSRHPNFKRLSNCAWLSLWENLPVWTFWTIWTFIHLFHVLLRDVDASWRNCQ